MLLVLSQELPNGSITVILDGRTHICDTVDKLQCFIGDMCGKGTLETRDAAIERADKAAECLEAIQQALKDWNGE